MAVDPINAHLKSLQKTRLLSKDEEKELFLAIAQGDQNAKKLMWECNLRLVVSVVKKYIGKGIDFNDLICIGNIALSKAIDKFDLKKGFKLSTFATEHIERAIKEEFKKISGFKLTKKERDNSQKYYAIQEYFTQKNKGKKPSLMEISKKMRISYAEACRLQELQNYSKSPSKDAPQKSNTEKGEFSLEIPDPKAHEIVTGEDKIEEFFTKERGLKFFYILNENQRKVLELRCGLIEGKSHTLQEIATKLGISKKRVFDIEKTSIEKIRKEIKKNYGTP